MKYLSLFSGIEAATQAWHPLGWEPVAFAEFDAFPKAVLAHRYPDVVDLDDVTKITEEQIAALGPIDLVVFGSPCQDLSVAGKRKGLAGERSGLFHTAIRIVEWAREHCGCRWALWENVPGAFSSNKGRDFAAVVDELAGVSLDVPPKGWGTEGCAVGEKGMVEWAVLDAQWFGVAQRRRRVFALADFGDWQGRQPILLEPESMRGDTAPRREAGQAATHDVAPCLRGRSNASHREDSDNYVGDVRRLGVKGYRMQSFGEYADDETASAMKMRDYKDATDLVAHSLRADGFDASEDGTGRGTPMVAIPIHDKATRHRGGGPTRDGDGCSNGLGIGKDGDPMPTYGTGDRHAVAVAFNARQDPYAWNEKTGTFDTDGTTQAVAYSFDSLSSNSMKSSNPHSGCNQVEVAKCLDTTNPDPSKNQGGNAILHAMQVRRLTPRECERLQGFPDDYTLIPYRNKVAADGPRYKALGNSMAVPVMRWIGEQIDMVRLFQ